MPLPNGSRGHEPPTGHFQRAYSVLTAHWNIVPHIGTQFRKARNASIARTALHAAVAATSPGPVISGALVALTSVLCPQYANYVFRAEVDMLFQRRTRSAFQEPFPSGRNPFVLSGKCVIELLNYLTTGGGLSRGKSCGGTAFHCAKGTLVVG